MRTLPVLPEIVRRAIIDHLGRAKSKVIDALGMLKICLSRLLALATSSSSV